jgi:amidase
MTMLPLVRAFGDLADFNIEDVTIATLQSAMQAGRLTAEALLDLYLQRIQALDWNGPTLRAVQQINPDAHASAQALDEERRNKGPRGPLHGIPVLLKDNIATADKLETTAGLSPLSARGRGRMPPLRASCGMLAWSSSAKRQ